MEPITIRIARKDEHFSGSFVIEQGGKICDGPGWDEMLGQLAVITFPAERVKRWGGTLYPMKTPDEWAEEEHRREARRVERQQQESASC